MAPTFTKSRNSNFVMSPRLCFTIFVVIYLVAMECFRRTPCTFLARRCGTMTRPVTDLRRSSGSTVPTRGASIMTCLSGSFSGSTCARTARRARLRSFLEINVDQQVGSHYPLRSLATTASCAEWVTSRELADGVCTWPCETVFSTTVGRHVVLNAVCRAALLSIAPAFGFMKTAELSGSAGMDEEGRA